MRQDGSADAGEGTSPVASPRDSPARILAGRIFPGQRRVWQISAVVLAAALVVTAIALVKPRQDLLGSNSVGARTPVAIVPPNTKLCVPDVLVPAGTGQVEYWLDTRTEPRPRLEVTIQVHGGPLYRGVTGPSPLGGHHVYDIPVPTLPPHPEAVLADVCLKPSALLFGWGVDGVQDNVPSPTIGGVPIPGRLGVWFLGPPGSKRTILSQVGEMFRRAALFRPGFVGAWTYWLIFLVLLPGLIYAAIRLLATADTRRRGRIPLPLLVALTAYGIFACWALVTPAFESPDESEHFAYVQYFAETGKAVETVQTPRPPYSDAEGLALEAVRHTSVIERNEARPPWLRAEVTRYEREGGVSPTHLKQNDGGGYHPAISPHTPAYYALLAPGYLLTKNDSVFSQLFAMRLTSALMGALTVMLAMLIVLELLPGMTSLAVAAGLLVAFEPQFGFISGAVNNDNGVNTATALLIYLVIRGLRRGLTPALGVALGATLVAAPLLKGTGYELYPAVVLGVLVMVLRRPGRRVAISLAALVASFLLLQFGWSQLASSIHHSTFTTPGGGTPGSTLEAFHNPKTYLSWLIRVMLPFSPSFIHHDWTVVHWPFFNIYIERGFASFGWYAIEFPKWVYLVIVTVIALAILMGLATIRRNRSRIASYLPEIGFLALVPIVVICAVEAAYEPALGIIPIEGTPEQGRYAFPAITAVAALFIGSCFVLGRRRALSLATVAVAALAGLTVASQLLTLSHFYT